MDDQGDDANANDNDEDDTLPAFERLPDEIIQQILQVTDANGFASLALLNSKWRSVAQQAHLYAHHLSICPSYAMSHKTSPLAASEDDLPRLRRLFAKEVKRNMFEAYLRPTKTVIKVISNSFSSSSSPGGEGIQFSPSPKGHHVLAYNSSRIHVIDARQSEITVTREFKILRRPAATCINDEGSMIAVLLTEMQVDIYDLSATPPKRTQSIILDHSPRAIALSPCGTVLAAAYEGGIEVSSLNPGALSTDRRAVKCDAGGKHEEAGWTFTYDRSFETFRAVRIDDLRNGTTYFTGPVPSPTSQAKLIPCTLPAASYYGELVSAGFQGKEIWLYGVPEDLDAVPDHTNASSGSGSSASALLRRNSGPSIRSASRSQENDDSARVPQWQILFDKQRNTLVKGYKIAELEGVNTVKWVADFQQSSIKERLVIAARGISPAKPITEDEGMDFVDGGRLTIIDFDYDVRNGAVNEIEIEVGTREPETLEEEHRDMATEVAIVRRRTVAQNRSNRNTMIRTATTASRPQPPPSGRPPEAGEETETQSIIEEQEAMEALDLPYSHASPRSGTTLRRAATAAAVNRRLHPHPATGPVEYRRADGRAEHPHESDADNWVPPPPPYQKEDPGDLPDFLRHAIPAVAVAGAQPARNQRPQSSAAPQSFRNSQASFQQLPRSQTVGPNRRSAPPVPAVPANYITPVPPVPPLPMHISQALQRSQESASTLRPPQLGNDVRPGSSDSMRHIEEENIYDVSPPDSPVMAPVSPPEATSPEPSGSRVGSRPVSRGQMGEATPSPPLPSNLPPVPPLPHISTAASSPHPGRAPALGLQIPAPTHNTAIPAWDGTQTGAGPSERRLSVSRTWPLQPKEQAPPSVALGYPYSAPPTNPDAHQALAQSLPPLPTPSQLASLNNRSHTPKRLSGGFQPQHIPSNSRGSGDFSSRPFTPKGVSGAFDPPGRQTSGRRAETPLLAPVPRHPRPTTQAAVLRPNMERLDTIYSVASNGQTAAGPSNLGGTAAPGSTSSTTRVPSLNRKQSRAERSAAKNIADARRRGWAGRSKSTKRRKPKKDFDAASTCSPVEDAELGPPAAASRLRMSALTSSATAGTVWVVWTVGPSRAPMGLPRDEFVAMSSLDGKGPDSIPSNAVVILASRSLASWVVDNAFVSRLLGPIHDANSHEGPAKLHVLSAVVDAIPHNGHQSSSEGLSILHGKLDDLLPGLWKTELSQTPPDVNAKPYIEFHLAPLKHDSRPLQVTVPLANTIFSNGKPHTIFASLWQTATGALPTMVDRVEKTSQVIVPRISSTDSSTVAVPLVPVTKPRRILAGLGNILRQVEIDAKLAPASKELEHVIPLLLQARTKRSLHQPIGPMRVWALIYPEHVAVSHQLPDALQLSGDGESHEWERANEVSKMMPELLAAGCHIRKILSGGGGWGLKQGLLSLDPQTKYSTPDQEDVESFIRSFMGEDTGGGVVAPGSFVQFFVELAGSLTTEIEVDVDSRVDSIDEPTLIIGSQDPAAEIPGPKQAEVSLNLFGAVSSEGIYLASDPATEGREVGEAIMTKIDSTASYVRY
ncbi:hypothetical protein B0T17DRAFT_592027 [Bombardia bombarda]|uniref:F-box domain-containing protein n=1 Tax=Bombardia bombarda TaxID=252184 RepID=A0AA40BY45_9PEZI|nr:hypothetical protein B0T17DRAFT_592027 [Bombardia bombarda]